MVGFMAVSKRAMPRGTVQDCCYQCLHPCGELLPTRASTEDPRRLAGSFGSVSCGFAASFLWVLVWGRFVCALQDWSLCFLHSYGSPKIKSRWPSRSDSLGIPSPFIRSPGWKPWCGAQNLHKWENSLVLLFSSFWGAYLVGMGFDFTVIVPLPLPWLLCLWMWGIVFWCVPASSCWRLIVGEQLVAILVLLQKEMSAHPSTPPSWTGTPDFFFKKSSLYTTQGCFFVIYLFLLLLGHFSICSKQGLDAVHGLLLLWRTGTWASVVVTLSLSCSKACGISLDQVSNPCLLHWQADSLSLSHKGKPSGMLLISFTNCIFPQLHWGKIDRNYIHIRYTMWCLGVCLHYEKIPTVKTN